MDDKVYLWIGDATGHGAPAALVTSAARSAASIVEAQKLTPAEAMKLMNLAIYDVANGEIMMTFFMATYDILSGQMTYVNASHEFPILVNRANETSFSKKDLQHIMDSNHPRLGEKRDTVFKEKTIQLKKGDLIFFYTDGLSDLRNADQVSLGERNFYKQLFVALKQQKLSEFMRTMETSLSQFRGTASLVDDVTYFVLSVEEGADASFGDSTTDDESMDAVVDF